jgi:tetratricopeptide (TPR) repeat protein
MTKKKDPNAAKNTGPDGEERDVRVRDLMGQAARLLAAKRPGEALPLLTEAWELDPENVAVAINLAGAYILQGKHRRAIPIMEQASQMAPNDVMVWTNLAAAYLDKLPFSNREMQDKAIAAFERALALDPRAPHVHYNLGLIYAERKDALHAGEHFQGALDTDPTDRDAQLWLDKIRRGDLDVPAPTGG